jgi:hypothetical protein
MPRFESIELSKNSEGNKRPSMEMPNKQTSGVLVLDQHESISPPRTSSDRYQSRPGIRVPCFFAAVFGFLLIQTFVFLAPPMPLRTCYLAGTIEKHKLIAEVPSPRVILVGGSNVAFGLDGEYLQKNLGVPVINMGLHGGLGLRYSLDEVVPYIKAGDVFILSPEYPQFDEPDGDLTLLQLLQVYPRGLQYIALENIAAFPRAFLQMSQFKRNWWGRRGFKSPAYDPVYNRAAFNANGDVISHLSRLTPPHANFPKELRLLGATDSSCPTIIALNKFQQICADRGATVFFAFPAVISDYYRQTENFSNIKLLDTNLRRHTSLIVLGTPGDNAYPPNDFFDAINHLTKGPRFERTKRLLVDLNNNPTAQKLFAKRLH